MDTNEKRRKAEELARQLRELNEQVGNEERRCQHDWNEPISDPEAYQAAEFDHYEPHGSDPEPIYRYHTAYRDRWSRTCKKCGKKEYTQKRKTVATAPDFG